MIMMMKRILRQQRKRRRSCHRYYYSVLFIFLTHGIPQRTRLGYYSYYDVVTADDRIFTRYNRNAYLAARNNQNDDKGDGDANHSLAMKNDDMYELQPHHGGDDGSSSSSSSSSSGGGNIPSFRPHHHHYDDPNQCTLYLAPSSIPNSGLGMYITISYHRGETFFPEVGIMTHDKHRSYSVVNTTNDNHYSASRLSDQYPWQSSALSLGAFEASYGESYIPGIGMLVNSHLGLVNVRLSERWMIQRSLDGTDSQFHSESLTLQDVGRIEQHEREIGR